MELYTCRIRLGGSPLNEVLKHNITPPEVVIMRALHGNDSVVDPQRTGMDKRSHKGERSRLAARYEQALAALDPGQSVSSLFGPPYVKLPVNLSDVHVEDDGDEDEDEVEDQDQGGDEFDPERPAATIQQQFMSGASAE